MSNVCSSSVSVYLCSLVWRRPEASGGIRRHLPSIMAVGRFGCGVLGEVRLARWFDLPQLVFHLENTVSKRVSLRDVVFWLKIHSSKPMRAWKTTHVWPEVILCLKPVLMILWLDIINWCSPRRPKMGGILLWSYEGEMGWRGEESLPVLWCWSRKSGSQCNNFASKMFFMVSKFGFHVSSQIQAPVP